MIPRMIANRIVANCFSGNVILVMGARQTGKTTLIQHLFQGRNTILWLYGDEPDTQKILNDISSHQLRTLIAGYSMMIIDEAQRIDDIGLILKRMADSLPEIQVVAIGSSSFELANRLNEPLTGRKWEYRLFPLSFSEMASYTHTMDEYRMLHHRLLYGYYPEVVTSPGREKELLQLLSDSYLYKDILQLDSIQKPSKLVKLLQALAYQIGSEVSYHELGKIVGLNSVTVERYIQVLEEAYIIFRLGSFSRNLRRELKKSKKIYFYDNGIRNAILADYSPIQTRPDRGALWENFLVSERKKYLSNNNLYRNMYFWRTLDQQEIDYIEEYDGRLHAYEFTWNPEKRGLVPQAFMKAYDVEAYATINPDNFFEFLM